MYQPFGQSGESSVNLTLIDSAFEDINANSIELTQLLNGFTSDSTAREAQEILTKVSVLIGFMISLRNQLLIFKKQSSLAGNATAKEYLNELKVQMDGLKSLAYTYGAIYTSLQEKQKLDQKLI